MIKLGGVFTTPGGGKRDIRELNLDTVMCMTGDFEDGVPIKVIPGNYGDFEGDVWPAPKKAPRENASVTRYRNVMNNLIARTSK